MAHNQGRQIGGVLCKLSVWLIGDCLGILFCLLAAWRLQIAEGLYRAVRRSATMWTLCSMNTHSARKIFAALQSSDHNGLKIEYQN